MSNPEGPYVILHGDIWYAPDGAKDRLGSAGRRVCGPHDMISVLYDGEDGVIHKHGAEDGVTAYAARVRKQFTDAGMPEVGEALVLVSFLPVQEAIDELNACVATTGRILSFPDRLGELAASNPELVPPAYPR